MPPLMSIPTCPSVVAPTTVRDTLVVAPTTAVKPSAPKPPVSVQSTVSPSPKVDTCMTDVSPHTPLPVAAAKSTASKSATNKQGEQKRELKGVPAERLLMGDRCAVPAYRG
ncbi:hypothetical protein ElyMa_002282800 [Elysia marginata]|uniref:Uncharacterized protein n=1 Tax=Elysia marginata TaxID=1093978 RepID=A0AAV4G0Z9_9GAST|nr:hypothetical protein ElyMa_002282800 [Elysia marginata]